MKRVVVLFVVLCLNLSIVFSQEDTTEFVRKFKYMPHVALKISPIAPLDFRSYFALALEHKAGSRMLMEYEVAYLTNYVSIWYPLAEAARPQFSGLRARVNTKILFQGQSKKTIPYISPELLFNYETYYKDETYLRYGGLYSQEFKAKRETYKYGLGVKGGIISYVNTQESIYIDFYGGLGVKAIDKKIVGIPEDATISNRNNIFGERPAGNYVVPNVLLGFKIGFELAPHKKTKKVSKNTSSQNPTLY